MAHLKASPLFEQSVKPVNLLASYRDPVDCLTAHLMLECSEVIAGAKPANLVSLVNRTRPCGRNLYLLWQNHGQQLAERLPQLEFKALQTKERAVLLLCFDRRHLSQHLGHAGIRALLARADYAADASTDQLLQVLAGRVATSSGFPHEIGLFIGYPAKDVAAFMGLVNLPFTCQGPWKIFGNPARSLDLADQFRSCRMRMNTLLASGDQSLLQLRNPKHPFFQPTNDNDSHSSVQRGSA